MTSCPEAIGWEFGDFEKEISWDPTLGRASPAGGYGMRSAFVGSDSTVSIVKIVSLSPRVEKLVKKLINVSYLNNGESSVFRISLNQYILHSTLPKTPELEPHYPMQFSIIIRTPQFEGDPSSSTKREIFGYQKILSNLEFRRHKVAIRLQIELWIALFLKSIVSVLLLQKSCCSVSFFLFFCFLFNGTSAASMKILVIHLLIWDE